MAKKKSRTSSPQFCLKKRAEYFIQFISNFPDTYHRQMGNFSAVLYIITVRRDVRVSQSTQCTTEFIYDRTITEYTHDAYRVMLLELCALMVELVPVRRIFEEWNSVSVRY